MPALSKATLVDTLYRELELSRPEAQKTVEQFFETLRQTLENGQNVKLSGFGNFILRNKDVRPGRNPKTGEEIPVQARRVVTFRAGNKLKIKVEGRKA